MNFAIRLLDNVCNVNDFAQVETIELIRGNPYRLYFQVVQPNKDGLRYSAATPATGVVKFQHNDGSKAISRAATMPFSEDRSIWYVDILATDEIQFNSMTFQLTEGTGPSAKVYTMNVLGDIVTVDTDTRKAFC
jgi:hypothetical protein